MTITINSVGYEFKTSFSELTIDEYAEFNKYFLLPVTERVSKFTGIPIDILNSVSLENFSNISELVSFLEDDKILSVISEPFTGKDVGLESFAKIEKAKGLISGDMFKAVIDVCAVYGHEIKGKPLLEVWHVYLFYLNSLKSFFERFKKLNLHEYTDEELDAGVEFLEGFKHYPIVFRMGRQRGMTNDEVLDLPAIEVYTELLYDYEQSEYEKRYTEIVRQRQEHFSKLQK